jgi:hypothetical protein
VDLPPADTGVLVQLTYRKKVTTRCSQGLPTVTFPYLHPSATTHVGKVSPQLLTSEKNPDTPWVFTSPNHRQVFRAESVFCSFPGYLLFLCW